jgi:hypothetical protein
LAPVFSDEAVRFRTQWFPPGYGKLAAFRLAELLRDELSRRRSDDDYLAIFLQNDVTTLKQRVADHWLRLADAAESSGDFKSAYRHLYGAGWDCGLSSLADYGPLLDRLAIAAEKAHWPALAKLARCHRRSLMG